MKYKIYWRDDADMTEYVLCYLEDASKAVWLAHFLNRFDSHFCYMVGIVR